MPHFRRLKQELRTYLRSQDFSISSLPTDFAQNPIEQWISPLFACLPEEDTLSFRAANMLGYAVAKIFSEDKERGRIIIRRLIWQMNEESGNIGWGIPVAFAECLAHSADLAKEYHRILISYIWDIDGDSNYCDHAPLRIYCYKAVELLLDTYPNYIDYATKALLLSAKDPDPICNRAALALIEKYKLSLY